MATYLQLGYSNDIADAIAIRAVGVLSNIGGKTFESISIQLCANEFEPKFYRSDLPYR